MIQKGREDGYLFCDERVIVAQGEWDNYLTTKQRSKVLASALCGNPNDKTVNFSFLVKLKFDQLPFLMQNEIAERCMVYTDDDDFFTFNKIILT